MLTSGLEFIYEDSVPSLFYLLLSFHFAAGWCERKREKGGVHVRPSSMFLSLPSAHHKMSPCHKICILVVEE